MSTYTYYDLKFDDFGSDSDEEYPSTSKCMLMSAYKVYPGDPITFDPVTSDPVTSNPVTSNPVTSNPVTSDPVSDLVNLLEAQTRIASVEEIPDNDEWAKRLEPVEMTQTDGTALTVNPTLTRNKVWAFYEVKPLV